MDKKEIIDIDSIKIIELNLNEILCIKVNYELLGNQVSVHCDRIISGFKEVLERAGFKNEVIVITKDIEIEKIKRT